MDKKFVIFIIFLSIIQYAYAYGSGCICDLDAGIYACPGGEPSRLDTIYFVGEGEISYCLSIQENMLRHTLYCSAGEHDAAYMLAHGHIICAYNDVAGAQYMLSGEDMLIQADDAGNYGILGIFATFGIMLGITYMLYIGLRRG